MRRLFNWWPPFRAAGIRVRSISPDFRSATVELRMRLFNRNYVGTHFGGSLFAMTDPFWMILLIRRLGPGYRVWDSAAQIEFVKPGRGTVVAQFVLDEATVADIRTATAGGDKHLRWFETDVVDAQGEVVARVRKQVYVRRAREPEVPARPG